MRLFQVIELASNMRPARNFLDPASFVQLPESSVSIGLQLAAEISQVLLGMFSFAIRRIRKPYCRSLSASGGAIIADVSPQAPRLGLPIPRRQNRHGRVIGVQLTCAHHISA